jgi:type II secretory pathway pseudopilin PulG
MALSASAIIVIVVVVSALCVTILWTFSGYYRRTSTMEEANTQISHEQDAYMRQVRQRNHEYAYTESVFSGGRTSRAWSSNPNNNDTTTLNTPMTLTGGGAGTPGWGAKRTNSNGKQSLAQGSANTGQQEKDGARVNYSSYEPPEYFEQSPYESNDYFYGYEQQPQQ